MNKIPFILTILLYLLIYLVRYQQVDFNHKKQSSTLDLFPQVRKVLDQKIASFLPSPQAELLSGIILGNKTDLPPSLKLELRDTATLHMVVVSGQNLTLLTGFVMNLAGIIRRKRAIALGLGLAIFYTVLTGGQIPVIRAALMVTLSSLAAMFGRQYDGARVLFITGGALLLINPLWISDLSFQLSFLATFGVIIVAPLLMKILKFVPALIKQNLAVTIGAQIMVIPVILQNFHQLSLVSVPANLMVGFTIPAIMIAGSITLVLSFIFTPLALIFALITSALLTYFIFIVKFFASLSFAWEYVGEQMWVVWVGYYMVLAGILSFLRKQESN